MKTVRQDLEERINEDMEKMEIYVPLKNDNKMKVTLISIKPGLALITLTIIMNDGEKDSLVETFIETELGFDTKSIVIKLRQKKKWENMIHAWDKKYDKCFNATINYIYGKNYINQARKYIIQQVGI